jgi:hypothetical protein
MNTKREVFRLALQQTPNTAGGSKEACKDVYTVGLEPSSALAACCIVSSAWRHARSCDQICALNIRLASPSPS